MKYTSQDTNLLQEAYSLQLLKESAPNMTLREIRNHLPYMTESELVYITEGLLNNMWSGVKNLGKWGKETVSNAAQTGVDAAKSLGTGALAAGSTIKNNAGNIYRTGTVEGSATAAIDKANAALKQLETLLLQTVKNNPDVDSGFTEADIPSLSINQIVKYLQDAKIVATQKSSDARNTGIFKGAGQSFKKGMGAQPQNNRVSPPLPQTA